jgi:hypothetical protein
MSLSEDLPPEDQVAVLAEFLNVPLQAEHLGEAARAWLLMAPHRQRVRDFGLAPDAEPAPLFRP